MRVPIRSVTWACDCGSGDPDALVHLQGCASQGAARAAARISAEGTGPDPDDAPILARAPADRPSGVGLRASDSDRPVPVPAASSSDSGLDLSRSADRGEAGDAGRADVGGTPSFAADRGLPDVPQLPDRPRGGRARRHLTLVPATSPAPRMFRGDGPRRDDCMSYGACLGRLLAADRNAPDAHCPVFCAHYEPAPRHALAELHTPRSSSLAAMREHAPGRIGPKVGRRRKRSRDA